MLVKQGKLNRDKHWTIIYRETLEGLLKQGELNRKYYTIIYIYICIDR